MTETEKSYNTKYYESNKARIKEQLIKKETCIFCKRTVSHQNMPKHKKSKLCFSNRPDTDRARELMDLLNNLQAKVENLEIKSTTA